MSTAAGRDGRSAPSATEGGIAGERGWPLVAQWRSLQSRLSSLLACGLMLVLGAGVLGWYYANAYSRQRAARQTQRSALAVRAQGDAPLPALGRIEAPQNRAASEPRGPTLAATEHEPVTPVSPELSALQAPTLMPQPLPATQSPAPARSPQELAAERRTAGAAFVRSDETQRGMPGPAAAAGTGVAAVPAQRGAGELPALLQPDVLQMARATVLPTRRWLLPKGAFIDCTLETAIDSTLPGMTTCITASDTFGADGEVVLLERGTKLVGETRGQVQQGAARVFVLWTEARTPAGIVIPLDSPGTDELGRSGFSGEVDRHFWQRFGAAMLITTLDGAVQAAVQSANHGSGPVIYDPSASAGIATDILKSTVNIPPTVSKHNGDRIEVLVARDLDFRTVYELRKVGSPHE